MVLKANRQALCDYIPQVYSGRITLFLCSEAAERCFYDGRLSWNEMAAEGLEVHVVPGNHDTLFKEPHVRVVAQKMLACVQRVQRPCASTELNRRAESIISDCVSFSGSVVSAAVKN